MSRPKAKRVLALSDLHCGHRAGLTPPGYWMNDDRWGPLQRWMWGWFEQELAAVGRVDLCLVLGDMIDGKGARSGGTELLTSSLLTQAEIATACLKQVKAGAFHCVYGTPYHVSVDGDDIEKLIAANIGADIGGHEWVEIGGVVFDLKHKIGGSQVPHGRFTSLARDVMWNRIWASEEAQPLADVLLRGHVHYCSQLDSQDCIAMTLPALQGPATTYGSRQCSGTVSFGFVEFTIIEGRVEWKKHLAKLRDIGRKVKRY